MKYTLALVLMVFGSFGAFANIGYELIDYQDPKVDEQGEFYIGDMVFISTYGYLKPCIIPLKQFKIGKKQPLGLTQSTEYKRRIPICKKTKESKFYEPDYPNYLSEGGLSRTTRLTLKVSVKEKKLGWSMCSRFSGINMFCAKELSDKELKIDNEFFVHSPEYPVQSISYLGKSKGLLKFTYEEVSNSYYNPVLKTNFGGDSQTIQFEVDPAESNTFSFKGALFEIIESSSSSITIKVIRDFPK
jgi:hypothetical protein